jgi:hypothetical protein
VSTCLMQVNVLVRVLLLYANLYLGTLLITKWYRKFITLFKINKMLNFYSSETLNITCTYVILLEELDGSAVRALGVRFQKLSDVRKGQSSDG